MREYETKGGKKIVLVPEGNAIRVMFSPGGELPEELTGKFTSEFFAERAILAYLANQEPKHEAKEERGSRSK